MSWRALVFSLYAAAACGCGMVKRSLPHSGRLYLDREGPRRSRLLDVPVEAFLCAPDTTVRLVGADRAWSAAVALRTPWPATVLEFAVESIVRGPGSAAVAARPIGDSVSAALTALRGTVRLSSRDRIAGTLDFVAGGWQGDTLRLVGRFDAPAATRGGCPAP